MRIAILETGKPPADLQPRFGDYPVMFRDLLGPDFEAVTFDVAAGALPESPDSFPAYLVTGSPAGVYEDHGWIGPLKGGDPEAAREIWNVYFRRLVGLARAKLGNLPRRAADERHLVRRADRRQPLFLQLRQHAAYVIVLVLDHRQHATGLIQLLLVSLFPPLHAHVFCFLDIVDQTI